MVYSFTSQGDLFVKIILMGAVISFCYDILRFFSKIITNRFYAVQIEDVLYWLSALFMTFSFFIGQSGGEIRLFSVFALLSGMLVYFFFVSPLFMKVSSVPAEYIRKAFNKTGSLIKTVIKKYGSLYNKKKNILHFHGKYAKIKVKKK